MMGSENSGEGRFKMVCTWCTSRMPTYHRSYEEALEMARIHDGLMHPRRSLATVVEVKR